MSIDRLGALSARLDLLEKQNRRLKRAGTLLLVVLGALLTMAFQAKDKDKKGSKSLEINKLTFKDADGVERGYLVVRKDGIGLGFAEDGTVRSGLILNADGAAVKFYKSGVANCGMGVQEGGVSLAIKGIAPGVDTGLNALLNGPGNSLVTTTVFDIPKKK